MTASQVIYELEALSPDEQAEVIRFVYRLDAERQLTGPELSLVRDAIIRGFYGANSHA